MNTESTIKQPQGWMQKGTIDAMQQMGATLDKWEDGRMYFSVSKTSSLIGHPQKLKRATHVIRHIFKARVFVKYL